MSNLIGYFTQDLKQYLKHQNPERDPLYWKTKDNEKLPIEAIEKVFNAKFCYGCKEWRYKEQFNILDPNTDENELHKGVSRRCNICINKKRKKEEEREMRINYYMTRMSIYNKLINDETFKPDSKLLQRFKIGYDRQDKLYYLED